MLFLCKKITVCRSENVIHNLVKITFIVRSLPCNYFIFHQDSALAHHLVKQSSHWRFKTPDFILPARWPPKSPDLSPVDYTVWSVMQEYVYEHRIKDVGELRECIVSGWTCPTSDWHCSHAVPNSSSCLLQSERRLLWTQPALINFD